jgi:hypothetical protein
MFNQPNYTEAFGDLYNVPSNDPADYGITEYDEPSGFDPLQVTPEDYSDLLGRTAAATGLSPDPARAYDQDYLRGYARVMLEKMNARLIAPAYLPSDERFQLVQLCELMYKIETYIAAQEEDLQYPPLTEEW